MTALLKKTHRGTIQLKADKPGEFRATFSTFNVVDRDGDVTIPGAFKEGQEVRISAWGHNWGALPVGRGVIHQDDAKAWCEGAFFLDTEAGKETYTTVKNLGELQEWSYGFDVLERSFGEFEGRENVQFLRSLDVFEVSPVMIGAGIDTGTDVIKGAKQSADLTTAERKTLEGIRDRQAENITSIDALLGVAEDPPTVKAEDLETGKAEESDAGKVETKGHAANVRQLLDLELLELESSDLVS